MSMIGLATSLTVFPKVVGKRQPRCSKETFVLPFLKEECPAARDLPCAAEPPQSWAPAQLSAPCTSAGSIVKRNTQMSGLSS